MFDSGCAGGVTTAAASGMRAAGRSRVRWQCPAAGASSTAPARAPPGASRAWKRWPALNFRGCGGSRAHGEWRHCATSGREGCGTGGERYALATFFVSPDCPPPAPPAVRRGGGRREPPPHRGTCPGIAAPGNLPGHRRTGELARRTRVRYALFPLLRLLTLHCTRKGSVAKGGGAQQRKRGVADDPERRPRARRRAGARAQVRAHVRERSGAGVRAQGPHHTGPSRRAVTPGPAAPPANRPHPPAPPTTRPTRAHPRTGACRPRCRRRAPRSRAPAPRTRTPRPARRSR